MKITSLVSSRTAVALLTAAVLATAIMAQAPQGPQAPQGAGGPGGQQGGGPGGGQGRGPGGQGGGQQQPAPPPTNLKVLPKDLSGDQVRDIMRTWRGETGMDCEDCHFVDKTKIGQNGRPTTDYPADKTPEKEMARIMYTMTEDMKHNYIPKVAALDPHTEDANDLTCGTCHRGKKDPEVYVPPPRQNGQGGQGGGQRGPQGGGQGGPQGAPQTVAPTQMGR